MLKVEGKVEMLLLRFFLQHNSGSRMYQESEFYESWKLREKEGREMKKKNRIRGREREWEEKGERREEDAKLGRSSFQGRSQ